MTELTLMVIASQLIANPTPSMLEKYTQLSPDDKAKVEMYINNQDRLPSEIEKMISKSKFKKEKMSPDSPSRETYAE